MPCSGPADASGAPLGVERVGLLERPRVERDHRVELRAVLVVGADAREILLDEIARRHGADPLRREQIDDALFEDVEGGSRRRRRKGSNQADLWLRLRAQARHRQRDGDNRPTHRPSVRHDVLSIVNTAGF